MAAAAGEGSGAAAAGAGRPRAWSWNGARLNALPVLTACPGVRSCSVGWDHTAVVCGRQRAVRSHGANASGQLGAGDTKAHKGFIVTDPPLHGAAEVHCGFEHTVALLPDGAVSSWGCSDILGRDGDPAVPAKVLSLPPVAAVFAGFDSTIVLTRDGGAYGFGNNNGALALPPDSDAEPLPVRIAALSGRRLRIRRTCIVALTEAGELWDVSDPAACRSISARLPPRQGLVPCGGVVARRVVLVPDHCGGRRRLTLFARLSIRLEIPGDPVREVLAPLVVHGDYITGPSSDPFGPPVDSG
eukprot:TRINITY_DN14748_c0_g1_i4.p1 TRINITY_DN14748_c0_g1~~TRINITY_DN14748_c0_g1_i4.p1  ORF type:complete len:323 (+),score=55.60 TRINITY_DN14748_c0_g1_i4:71-970(+)